ncbi:LysM domain-containing protein [Mobilisporobacter senegalensis]|uniref:LysM domain-containing protein n=1 Tax=Mobilisporobacter senegalensis TaxID=1329262 RepID=A0A3N1XAT8_9FIRM|nr:LysM peptidoglycan-binding domain-containing protein [Mobilisporobacter senegalensis]ROR23884.1 LysM domain-containing protein [Mobilisporobacter senegalensis]
MYVYTDQYTVEPGDTLSSIARQFDLPSYRQLLYINRDILNSNALYPGQRINIPKMIPMTTYIVEPGDTLGNIVYHYNRDLMDIYGHEITFDEVMAYNPEITNPNNIYPDMVIYLPEIL